MVHVSRLLLGLFAGLCLFVFSEGAWFSYCQRDRKIVGVSEGLYMVCDVKCTSTVRWTVIKETGAKVHIGICYGPGNCTNLYRGSRVVTKHTGSASSVFISQISPQLAGEMTCQETLTNGTVLSDTCPVNIVRINFQQPRVDIQENGTKYIRCHSSRYTPSTLTWRLTTNSGQTLHLGTCTAVNTCTSPHAPEFILQRADNYESQLNFQRIDRSKSGTGFASFTYNGLTETVNFTLTVYNPATISNCHAEMHPGNWSSILSCDVSNVFSSAGLYNFRVYAYFRKVLEHGITGAPTYRYLFNGDLSYRHMLTPYTNSTDNKLYYRGRLTYSWPLPPTPGIYGGLGVNVYYGFYSYADKYVGYRVNIITPSQPTHNCSELNYIPETGVVPCTCTADSLGSPAGRLVWLLGNVPIATGDYGVTQLTFPSSKVSRQHDGMMVTCQLDWVQPMTTVLSSHVPFTPRQPTQNCSELNYIPETGVVPCACTADYLGSPPGRLVWLLGNTTIATGDYGVTQLTFPSGKVSREHDGMMVTCQLDWLRPINTAFTSHVTHGPDSLTLQVMQSNDVGNNIWFNVISHVTEMKPMKADMMQWGGLCQGQQGFTCTLTPRSAAEVDGKTVTCRVTNAANNGHSAEASVVLKSSAISQSQTEKDQFNWTAVGVGIALGIVVIALVVLVVVVIVLNRRGRLCKSPTPNAPTSQDDDDSHIYTGLKLSKVKKKKRNGAKKGVTCPPVVFQGDGDPVYENTTMGGQRGHM